MRPGDRLAHVWDGKRASHVQAEHLAPGPLRLSARREGGRPVTTQEEGARSFSIFPEEGIIA